jgi:hypothetical protein
MSAVLLCALSCLLIHAQTHEHFIHILWLIQLTMICVCRGNGQWTFLCHVCPHWCPLPLLATRHAFPSMGPSSSLFMRLNDVVLCNCPEPGANDLVILQYQVNGMCILYSVSHSDGSRLCAVGVGISQFQGLGFRVSRECYSVCSGCGYLSIPGFRV